ncbi:MAG: hypothetical protein KDD60_07940, partial [Bdellovibrionales bacterium]|nr:hypothetical protein [Bdellovibrionales bacterium]
SKMLLRRMPLNEEIWSDRQGAELVGLIALIKRIRVYWEICTESKYFSLVPQDDQGLYDTFIADLFFLLDRANLDTETRQLIIDSIPLEFINSDLALVLDEEIRGYIQDGFGKAISALRREAISRGQFTTEDDPTLLFSLFDDELEAIRELSTERFQKAEKHLNLLLSQYDKPVEKQVKTLERRIRKEISLILSEEWTRVPKDIRQKSEQRYAKEQTRNPLLPYKSMVDKLGYIDLGDLETVMVEGRNWPSFEKSFSPKAELRNRFRMLAPFRNSEAHARDADEPAIADAKAAIAWFDARFSIGLE